MSRKERRGLGADNPEKATITVAGKHNQIDLKGSYNPSGNSLADAILAREGLPLTFDTSPIVPDTTPLLSKRRGRWRRGKKPGE